MEGLELKDRFMVRYMSTIGTRKRKYPRLVPIFYMNLKKQNINILEVE